MGVLTSSQIVLEWSADPLSDTTPTYVTVSNTEIRSLEWWAGIDREGNDPEPGGMVVHLKNVNRKWEPLFGSNTIDLQQRFRLTVAGVQEGVFYSQDFELDYTSGQEYSEVTITCGDGFDVLAQDDLLGLDPPEAESYDDVESFDEPWGAWPMDELAGTAARAIIKRVFRGKGKHRRKVKVRRGTRYSTAAEAAGSVGPSGVYKNTPTLGVDGLIVGDPGTAVRFASASSEYMVVVIDDGDTFKVPNAVTAEVWVKPTTTASGLVVAGPRDTSGASTGPIFSLTIESGPVWGANFIIGDQFRTLTSSTVPAVDTVAHVVTTWDGTTLTLYINGFAEDAESWGGSLDTPDAGEDLYIAGKPAASFCNATLGRVAVYEYALSAERVLAHYQAGAERGYAQQTAGERIAAIATHALWSEASIQTTGRDVLPVMQHGQGKLEEIAETAHAEGPRTLFFFNGSGNPVYLGHEFQATAAVYNTVQATFSDGGGATIPYNDVEINFDNEVYNEVLVSHESGPEVLASDTTSQATRGRRARTEETDLLLMEHNHVESLAYAVLALYQSPAMRPVSLTIDNHHALTQIKTLDIGHLVRVQKAGVTGDPIDRITTIIGKRKAIDVNRLYTCTYTLARGFDANDDLWRAGIVGASEAGSTTVAA